MCIHCARVLYLGVSGQWSYTIGVTCVYIVHVYFIWEYLVNGLIQQVLHVYTLCTCTLFGSIWSMVLYTRCYMCIHCARVLYLGVSGQWSYTLGVTCVYIVYVYFIWEYLVNGLIQHYREYV